MMSRSRDKSADVVLLVTSTWDKNNSRTSLAATIGGTADFKNDYLYDNLNRMTRVTQQSQSGGNAVATKRVDFAYNALGQFTNLARYEDLAGTQQVATTSYGYDNLHRLTSLAHTKGAQTLAGYTYTFDAAGRLTSENSVKDGLSTFTYDHTDQLNGGTYVLFGQTQTWSLDYDANGNRQSLADSFWGNRSYQTGANNHTLCGGGTVYQYDDEGNRKSDTVNRVLEWDHRGRLARTYDGTPGNPANYIIEYTYDAFDRLVARKFTDENGVIDHVFGVSGHMVFVHDGDQIVLRFGESQEVVDELEERYLWAVAVDQLLAEESLEWVDDLQEAQWDIEWALADHQQSIRDRAGYDAVTDTVSFDPLHHRRLLPFGYIHAWYDVTFGYTGRLGDGFLGWQWNLHRWYEPHLGQWLSEDPIGFNAGDTNLRRYVFNSPTNLVDPTGLVIPGDGHHLVNQANWTGMPEAVMEIFNSDDARIHNEYYTFHNGSTVNGVTHYQYNIEVKKELTAFLGGRHPCTMTVEEAKTFLGQIKNSKNAIISAFNKGIEAEAYAAQQAGKLAYDVAIKAGKTDKQAREIGQRVARDAVLKTRTLINEVAAKNAGNAATAAAGETAAKKGGRKISRWLLSEIPIIGTLFAAGYAYGETGDLNATGRAAFLELTCLDTPVDLAEFFGMFVEEAKAEIDEFSERVRRSPKWSMEPAWKLREEE